MHGMDTQLACACRTVDVRPPARLRTPFDLSLDKFLFYTLGFGLPCAHSTTPNGYLTRQDRRMERSRGKCLHWVQRGAFRPRHDPSIIIHTPHLHSSSFDEPLTNAMSAEMAYDLGAGGGRVMTPMPNGAAQQQSTWARMETPLSGSEARALSGMSMGRRIPIRVRVLEG